MNLNTQKCTVCHVCIFICSCKTNLLQHKPVLFSFVVLRPDQQFQLHEKKKKKKKKKQENVNKTPASSYANTSLNFCAHGQAGEELNKL